MAEDLEITKAEKIRILLTEYQVAQQNADAAGNRTWQLTGLLFVTALGSIAIMVQARGSWVVFPIALGSIALIFFWTITFAREQFYCRATYSRIQHIEQLLGLEDGLHTWIKKWDKVNSTTQKVKDKEIKQYLDDYVYIWQRQRKLVRWLGCRRTQNWALIVALASAVTLLIVAFGLVNPFCWRSLVPFFSC